LKQRTQVRANFLIQPVFASTSLRIFSACAAAFEVSSSVYEQRMWLSVVPPMQVLAAVAILRVPYAASFRPDTF
jgi:hypothetical protein